MAVSSSRGSKGTGTKSFLDGYERERKRERGREGERVRAKETPQRTQLCCGRASELPW